MNNPVRVGVIGLGVGMERARAIANGQIGGAVLSALCSRSIDRRDIDGLVGGKNIPLFRNAVDLMDSEMVDAVVIATPHMTHSELAVEAFARGKHVMTEKPAGIRTGNVSAMNEVARRSGRTFGIMFQKRLNPVNTCIKECISSGTIGAIQRILWVATNWYRPQTYYDAKPWRGTWAGEGGAMLINQCSHDLDLFQWFFGLPIRVMAFCRCGRYHRIEGEDDCTAYMEFADGASATFIASTGELHGAGRLEISGERGRLTSESGVVTLHERNRPTRELFSTPREGDTPGDECADVLRNWIGAIRNRESLFISGEEGIRSLELSNAMQMSAWTDSWVNLPVDAQQYFTLLQRAAGGNLNGC